MACPPHALSQLMSLTEEWQNVTELDLEPVDQGTITSSSIISSKTVELGHDQEDDRKFKLHQSDRQEKERLVAYRNFATIILPCLGLDCQTMSCLVLIFEFFFPLVSCLCICLYLCLFVHVIYFIFCTSFLSWCCLNVFSCLILPCLVLSCLVVSCLVLA